MAAFHILLLFALVFACQAQQPSTVDTLPDKSALTTPDDPADIPMPGKIYTFAEEMPEYPGGTKAMVSFFNANARFPQQDELQSKVTVSFIVEPDGTLTNVEVLKKFYGNTYSPIDLEAIRVIKLIKKMEPGRQNGQPVAVLMHFPVSCILWQD